jgi:hypothetical protein
MYLRISLIVVFSILTPNSVWAQDIQLEMTEAAFPEVVSQETRGVTDRGPYTISVDGQAAARFWLRGDPPSSSSPSSELGVTFGQLESGSLLGVVELVQPWADYKNTSIQPGTYTMRYGVMPEDGNHMGVSPYRDYLMLIPAAEDSDPKRSFNYVELITGSAQASGVPHPAVLALFPIWDEISEPTLTKNEMDQWTFAIKLGDRVLGLVVLGHGEV